jgi:hypothetical protein
MSTQTLRLLAPSTRWDQDGDDTIGLGPQRTVAKLGPSVISKFLTAIGVRET